MLRKTRSLDSNYRIEAKKQDDWWFHEEPLLNIGETFMTKWKKIRKRVRSILTTKIPGSTWAPILTGALLGTTMVLFTRLPVSPPKGFTLEENTSFKNESLEILVSLPSGEKLLVKVTGETTMEVVMSLRQMLSNMDGTLFLEKSSLYTPHLDASTTRRPDNSSYIMY
tara:strand:- start:1236 stop:1739 length:504 start_codon:yes stop_codon:yes gene_type:complete